jgi:hypothetical protein
MGTAEALEYVVLTRRLCATARPPCRELQLELAQCAGKGLVRPSASVGADRTLTTLTGDEIHLRRRLIQSDALHVGNIDV